MPTQPTTIIVCSHLNQEQLTAVQARFPDAIHYLSMATPEQALTKLGLGWRLRQIGARGDIAIVGHIGCSGWLKFCRRSKRRPSDAQLAEYQRRGLNLALIVVAQRLKWRREEPSMWAYRLGTDNCVHLVGTRSPGSRRPDSSLSGRRVPSY